MYQPFDPPAPPVQVEVPSCGFTDCDSLTHQRVALASFPTVIVSAVDFAYVVKPVEASAIASVGSVGDVVSSVIVADPAFEMFIAESRKKT